VGKAGGGFRTSGRAPNTTTAADVNSVVIKIKNFGTILETDVPYRVIGACTIDQNGDGDTNDCGSVVYSGPCTGNAATLSGGSLTPKEVVSVPGCIVIFGPNEAADTGDTWTHTLVITHCGTDGTVPPCSSNDGGVDADPDNNIATKNTKVLP
jgi:hypothetical protein